MISPAKIVVEPYEVKAEELVAETDVMKVEEIPEILVTDCANAKCLPSPTSSDENGERDEEQIEIERLKAQVIGDWKNSR